MKRRGLHQEQTRRGVRSVTTNPVQKKRYSTPLEFQERESREVKTFKEYLKMDTNKKAKKTKSKSQAARQQSTASSSAQKATCTESDQAYKETCAQILQVVDQACVGQESGPAPRGQQYNQSLPDGIHTLTEFTAWIANRCTNLEYIRCRRDSSQEVVQEILNKESKRGKIGYVTKWRDTVVLKKHVELYAKHNCIPEEVKDFIRPIYVASCLGVGLAR